MILTVKYNKITNEIILTKDEDLVNAVINDATIVDTDTELEFEIAVDLNEWNNQFEDVDGDNNE